MNLETVRWLQVENTTNPTRECLTLCGNGVKLRHQL
jgi:hypothetical protein